jgi:hypothetical protein
MPASLYYGKPFFKETTEMKNLSAKYFSAPKLKAERLAKPFSIS